MAGSVRKDELITQQHGVPAVQVADAIGRAVHDYVCMLKYKDVEAVSTAGRSHLPPCDAATARCKPPQQPCSSEGTFCGPTCCT